MSAAHRQHDEEYDKKINGHQGYATTTGASFDSTSLDWRGNKHDDCNRKDDACLRL